MHGRDKLGTLAVVRCTCFVDAPDQVGKEERVEAAVELVDHDDAIVVEDIQPGAGEFEQSPSTVRFIVNAYKMMPAASLRGMFELDIDNLDDRRAALGQILEQLRRRGRMDLVQTLLPGMRLDVGNGDIRIPQQREDTLLEALALPDVLDGVAGMNAFRLQHS